MHKPDSFTLLQTWFSPSFPVGAYTYSHGLETSFNIGSVTDEESCFEWIADNITLGDGLSALVFARKAHEITKAKNWEELGEFLNFVQSSFATKELKLESISQGRAFHKIMVETWPLTQDAAEQILSGNILPYECVTGVYAADRGIDSETFLSAFLHAYTANLISAAVRIIPLGQTQGQRIQRKINDMIRTVVTKSGKLIYDQVGVSTVMQLRSSMKHETLHTRIFRS